MSQNLEINHSLSRYGCRVKAANEVEVSVCEMRTWKDPGDGGEVSRYAGIHVRGSIRDKERGETRAVKWSFSWDPSDTPSFQKAIDTVLAPDDRYLNRVREGTRTVYKKYINVSDWLRVGLVDHFFEDRENEWYAYLQFFRDGRHLIAKFHDAADLNAIRDRIVECAAQ